MLFLLIDRFVVIILYRNPQWMVFVFDILIIFNRFHFLVTEQTAATRFLLNSKMNRVNCLNWIFMTLFSTYCLYLVSATNISQMLVTCYFVVFTSTKWIFTAVFISEKGAYGTNAAYNGSKNQR